MTILRAFSALSSSARAFARSPSATAALALAAACSAAALDSASLASKSIAQVYAVQNRVFAIAEGGATYSSLDLFSGTPQIRTRTWPWLGGIEGGASWSSSLMLRANYWISDSQRVARATSLRYDGSFRGGDSLVFRDPLDTAGISPLAESARLTALAVRDTAAGQPALAAMGFGRLGVAYATLAPESNAALFALADSLARFMAFPSASDAPVALYECRWNRLCRADTLTVPAGGLDSVIALAIDSSHADSLWLLVATQKGLRRGLWGGASFPYVSFPNPDVAGAAVRSVFASPRQGLAWAFTGTRYFFSDDHGATWRVPAAVPGVSFDPAPLSFSSDRPPQAAFYGDTTIINFSLDRPGLILFRNDTILANAGPGLGEVLLDTADGLDIAPGEGSLTTLALARGTVNPAQAVLVSGSTLKGVFHRRMDQPGTDFANTSRFESLRGDLNEVITYPTLFTAAKTCGEAHVRLGYRLGKDGRVTITVFNAAMEKVRVIVKNAPRQSGRGTGRSESLADDRWDGCDESGRFVSVGTYYILVQSDKGEKGFGKALVTRGRK